MPSTFALVVAGITLLYLALITTTPSWLIGTPEYKWPVLMHGQWGKLPGAILITGIAVTLGVLLVRRVEGGLKARFGKARLYAALLLLGLAFQLGPATVHRMGFIELPLRVYLQDHTSYFTDAKEISSFRRWSRNFPGSIRGMETHTRTHPPGAVLPFYLSIKVMESAPGLSSAISSWLPRSEEAKQSFRMSDAEVAAGLLMGLVLVLAAAACVPLAYAIARETGPPWMAAAGALLFAAMPAFSHKAPMLDHLLGLIMLVSLWLSITAVTRKQLWRIAAAGAIVGAGLWMGTSLLAAPALCVVYVAAAIYAFRQEGTGMKEPALLMLSFLLIFLGASVGALLLTGATMGASPLPVYRAITQVGWKLNNELSGRYSTWMWMAFNPYEVLAWSGVPVAAYFLRSVVYGGRGIVSRKGKEVRTVVNPWLWALFFFLLALDLSGRVVYEASRLVWFCFPLIAIEAAREMPPSETDRGHITLALMASLCAGGTLVFRFIF